ncbi:hypothetical protein KC19_3G089300 [Ceratodon purpureus]|uniref:Uncharacterized protein n=1 Tax=Ceratodon purpureus TaxID=3225 RepID=A0A8T0IJW7_CERPU|nr:hypothetical protein KC19_3G089300 [Ceratodon purpureus]
MSPPIFTHLSKKIGLPRNPPLFQIPLYTPPVTASSTAHRTSPSLQKPKQTRLVSHRNQPNTSDATKSNSRLMIILATHRFRPSTELMPFNSTYESHWKKT